MSDIAIPTSQPEQIGLFDRALRRVASLWRDMASAVAGGAEEGIEAQMRACLDGRGGEVSARNRAARLAQEYLAADEAGRLAFLRALAGFDSDPEMVARAIERVQAARDRAERSAAQAQLRRALEPPRLRLLTQFTTIPDGVKFLVNLRAHLLRAANGDPLLAALEADLKSLLASWFDVGFLDLRRIDWSSPASLLEKLVGYEAVHRIRTWRDLKNRLDSDRRCYAFFHPRMPDEPLIFVEVALVEGMAGSVQRLLDEKAPLLDPREADTAIFYSINNCQRGLAGISFGNFLIKRVVALLGAEFRNLKTFATLSPIPGFCRWLEHALAEDPRLLSEAEAEALLAAAPPPPALPAPEGAAAGPGAAPAGTMPPSGGAQALRRLLARRGWHRDEALAKVLEPVLTRLCARYLLAESDPRDPKRARDPVAHFHLSNGARIERINWKADVSEKGLRESAGLMVNYLYDPAKIEDYHEDYVGEGKRPAATALRRLARGWG
ncbi:malonyl-CoA decarboxylase [Caldovatus sp. SYSU G05006]|uniref:Malonyl-CoA decarboxylase n=1 Tax=Caldovatus aquaticus TaxID=2865671 RepID=A0ABS7F1E0_9PROT|nr:malonyl-CoA decarboxylase [Caldovatus aquaticus]MBW8268626.1 malonyl-CoA decarboxylase [Caldovatus aquaticus]